MCIPDFLCGLNSRQLPLASSTPSPHPRTFLRAGQLYPAKVNSRPSKSAESWDPMRLARNRPSRPIVRRAPGFLTNPYPLTPVPCSSPAGADALRRLRPAKAGLRTLRRYGGSGLAAAAPQAPPGAGVHLGGRAFGPSFCGGIPPATPPQKTQLPTRPASAAPVSGPYPPSPIPYPLPFPPPSKPAPQPYAIVVASRLCLSQT